MKEFNKEVLIDYLESRNWSVNELENKTPNEIWFEIETHSPAGEDLVEDLLFSPNLKSFLKELANLYYCFNEQEHVKMWLEADHVDGVPDVFVLVDDAKAIKEMYRDLYFGASDL